MTATNGMTNVTFLEINTEAASWSSRLCNAAGASSHIFIRTSQQKGDPHPVLSRSTRENFLFFKRRTKADWGHENFTQGIPRSRRRDGQAQAMADEGEGILQIGGGLPKETRGAHPGIERAAESPLRL